MWAVRLYYPQKGLVIIAKTLSEKNILDEASFVTGILLVLPGEINDIFLQEKELGYLGEPLDDFGEWNGYGDLNDY